MVSFSLAHNNPCTLGWGIPLSSPYLQIYPYHGPNIDYHDTLSQKLYFDLSSTPLQSHPFNTVYPIFGHPPDTRSCFTVVSIIPFFPNQGKFSSPIHLEHHSCHHFIHPLHSFPITRLIKSIPRSPLLLAVMHPFPINVNTSFQEDGSILALNPLLLSSLGRHKKSPHRF
jgi:hypothetical protein